MQEQEEEQQHLESQLSTIKNYDAEAKQRMAELREQELAIERSEVLIDVYRIASQNFCHIEYFAFRDDTQLNISYIPPSIVQQVEFNCDNFCP